MSSAAAPDRTIAEGDATIAAFAVIECCIGFVPLGWVGTCGTGVLRITVEVVCPAVGEGDTIAMNGRGALIGI